MRAFHFKAINAGGKVTSGTLEAASSVAARQTLRSQGLLPLEVTDAAPEKILHRPMARAAGALPRSRSGRIPLAALTLITRQMATLLGAGLRVEDALSAIAVGQPPKVAGILLTVRGSVLALREREFILSARAIGVGSGRIIFTHILPNVLGPIVILMTLNVANNILLESSLTFLALGVDPTIPSWGGMLADGRTYLQTAWWVSVFPGLAILLTVLGLNLLGDWLRDSLDPTGRTSR